MSVVFPWTADSRITADSDYTTSGYGPLASPQYPNVPALPGVPNLARLATAAVVREGATISGETQALARQLGLPATVTFGTNALYAGLGLSPLSSQSSPQSQNANPNISPGVLPPYGIFSTGTVSLGPITTTFSDGSTETVPAETVGSFNAKWVINPDSVVELDFDADSNVNSHPVEQGGFSAYNRVQQPTAIRLLLACQGKNMTRSTFLSTLASLREGTQIVTIATPDASYPNMVLKRYGYKKAADRGAVTIWADTEWAEERSKNVVVSAPPTSQPQGASVSNLGTLQPITPTAQQQASISNPLVIPSLLPAPYSNTAPPSGDAF